MYNDTRISRHLVYATTCAHGKVHALSRLFHPWSPVQFSGQAPGRKYLLNVQHKIVSNFYGWQVLSHLMNLYKQLSTIPGRNDQPLAPKGVQNKVYSQLMAQRSFDPCFFVVKPVEGFWFSENTLLLPSRTNHCQVFHHILTKNKIRAACLAWVLQEKSRIYE